MKKFLIILALVFPFQTSAGTGLSWSLTQEFDSGYIVASGTEVYDGMFSRTLLTARNGNWFAELWAGTGLERNIGVVEVDYTVGKNFKLGKLDVTAKLSWFDIYGPDNLGFGNVEGDVYNPVLEWSYPLSINGNSFTFGEVQYLFVKGDSENNGAFTNIGFGRKLSIGQFSITGKARIGYDGSYNINEPYIRAEVTTKYVVDDKVSLSGPGVKWIAVAHGHEPVVSYNIVGVSYAW